MCKCGEGGGWLRIDNFKEYVVAEDLVCYCSIVLGCSFVVVCYFFRDIFQHLFSVYFLFTFLQF